MANFIVDGWSAGHLRDMCREIKHFGIGNLPTPGKKKRGEPPGPPRLQFEGPTARRNTSLKVSTEPSPARCLMVFFHNLESMSQTGVNEL
jgi:hypothetical protein